MSDNMNPWDNRGKRPNELEDMIQQGLKKLFGQKRDKAPPPGNGGGRKEGFQPPKKLNIGIIVVVVLILFVGFRSFYQVNPGEQGVVLRFGKYHKTTKPGLNFLIPFIEKVVKMDVESVQKEGFGFRQGSSKNFSGSSNSNDLESLMITSDNNVIQLNWVVQYRIAIPEDYLFNVENPRAMVRDISESVIRRMVGNRDFNFVLNNRNELALSTLTEMQNHLDNYESGIRLLTVQLQDLNPPDPVRPSFNEVNEAEQDKVRLGNEAQQERNRRIPKAEGSAKKMLEEAQGYAIERINNAKGNVARFNAIYREYKNYKDVTRTRMYIETLQSVLPSVREVTILDQSALALLPLSSGQATTGTTPAKTN